MVLVDRQRARLFRFEQGELSEGTEVFDAVPRRHDQGGRSASNIQRHTDELAHKHLKHAAEVTFEEVGRNPVDHLILGGPHEVVTEFEEKYAQLEQALVAAVRKLPAGVALRHVVCEPSRRDAKRPACQAGL